MPLPWLTGAAILLLLAFSALLTGAETALSAASRARLRARADQGDARARRALQLAEDRETLAGAVLLLGTLLRILAASLATALALHLALPGGLWWAAGLTALLILALAEALPRRLALRAPEDLACRLAAPMAALCRIAAPARLLPGAGPLTSVQDEIADTLAVAQSSGTVAKDQRDRLLGALDLGERAVEEIMLHRSNIQMIDARLPPDAVLDLVLKSPHTRLPVFRDERENVVGVIHAKDLLRGMRRAMRDGGPGALQDFDLLAAAMPPYFVPDTTTLDEQMREFLKRRTHFALVVDEYGSLRGLITLEDILEEIVGEITDEHDTDALASLVRDARGDYLVEGAMTIRDLNRALDWSLPDDEANTVAGLVIHMAQSIPTPGQVFSFHGCRFEVVARRENRITRLRIRPLGEPPGPADQ
ncbi:HlyC/CorC family transporter [Paracoccus sp. DMF]|uniref:HlyC/CorC family transporter n=1 Tax=Paracoccus sp. DMF TaxID=400837 RepID=UPI0021E3EAAA|nr:CNNM domain-containing protein [Paracoccus sp. DMF]MCV2448671.1 CNNM domain-containing protein [Paracoccus sp. DMF]